MQKIHAIFETRDVVEYLQSRNLLEQYKKAKRFLLQGNFLQTSFKKRNPKKANIWYFRVTKKYRAFCSLNEEGDLVVFEINDHQ
ncbi:MAG: hypothetical protein AAB592_00710 [Patescibacteria group bacterium]